MTCAEALAALSTASLREIAPESPLMQHCAECPECSRVTTMVRAHEYEAASVLNNLPPMAKPVTVAQQSVVSSRRRKAGKIAVVLTGAALVATTWIAAWLTIIPALNEGDSRHASSFQTETIQLSCLSPEQAGDIISPYVRSHGSTYYVPSSDIRAITVRGNVSEVARARAIISQFESDPSAACRVEGKVGSEPRDAVTDGVAGGVTGATKIPR
jgi:hypothetical protein